MNKKHNLRFSTLQEPYNRLYVYRCVLFMLFYIFFVLHIFYVALFTKHCHDKQHTKETISLIFYLYRFLNES